MSEEYIGVKFKPVLVKGKTEKTHASELISWCRKFFNQKIASLNGPAGNISVRTKKGFLITPSGRNFSSLSENDLAEVIELNEETKTVKALGLLFPSSESFLHAAIYNARHDVNAVMHGHCDFITKNCAGLGIPETFKEAPYGSLESKEEVLKILKGHSFIQIKNHGFLSLGSSLEEAGENVLNQLKKQKMPDNFK